MNALRTVLSVAAADRPLTITQVAEDLGLDYHPIALQIGQLSDGRGTNPGLRLLRRLPGRDRREKLIAMSRTGCATGVLFSRKAPGEGLKEVDREWIRDGVNPAIDQLLEVAPDMALGTLCVFLYAVVNSDRFGHYGEPSSIIARALGVSNLPVHLGNLSGKATQGRGISLLTLTKHPMDRRMTMPQPNDQGLALASRMASTLLGRSPSPVIRPKVERLLAAGSPDDVAAFENNDFEVVDVAGSLQRNEDTDDQASP